MGLTKVTMGLLSGLAAKVLDIMKDHSNINLGEAKAATGTFVDFSIPAGVKRVNIRFSGVSTNGASAPIVRVGSGSFLTSGYLSAHGTHWGTAYSGVTTSTTGLLLYTTLLAAWALSGKMTLSRHVNNTWVSEVQGMRAEGFPSVGFGNCPTLSGDLDRIRITTENGTDTFDSGTIDISWEF